MVLSFIGSWMIHFTIQFHFSSQFCPRLIPSSTILDEPKAIIL